MVIDLRQHFEDMKNALMSGDSRYEVLDHDHVMDKNLNLKYHIHFGPNALECHVTDASGNKVLNSNYDLTKDEGQVLHEIKQMLNSSYGEYSRNNFYNMVSQPSHDTSKMNIKPVGNSPHAGKK